MTTPRATARVQFHAGFTLDDAAAQVDYFARLGVSHLYASPILAARKGSTHGYDVIDCHAINPEIGGEPALRRLVAALRAHDMGLILDIVPNHMGVGPENAWWMDVLAKGRESRYAGYFDIEWTAPDPLVRGRVLLPILGESYFDVLHGGHIALVRHGDTFALRVYDAELPIAPGDQKRLNDIQGDALAMHHHGTDEGRQALDALIDRQHYRLALWKLASDLVNYRRFFDINELAGLRQESVRVFEDTHALVFRLYAEGLIDGVRCDHVDGLASPRRYCRQLRNRLDLLRRQRPAGAPRTAYLVVEKILAMDEDLRADWRVDGTTGYEFMDEVSALLHDEAGRADLTALWTSASGDTAGFVRYAHAARRQILVDSFESELARTSRALFSAARATLATRDVSEAAIRRVLRELLVHFPVYRTYAGGAGRDAIDEVVFTRAIEGAIRVLRPEDHALLVEVGQWLGGQAPRQLPPGAVRRAREKAIAVFQQATSPVAAKAVEDTAGYRYGRLLSRNEVGADPDVIAIEPPAFHARCQHRAESFPRNMITTATHDHKRGADLRMRLAVLSERASWWQSQATAWRERHVPYKRPVDGRLAPTPVDELMLYQMLLGAWPLVETEPRAAFVSRIEAWQMKALREAKRRTRWTDPNEPYEEACKAFLAAVMADEGFVAELEEAAASLAVPGAANGLAQAVLHLTTPGVPDIYQGTEYWDFSLVDPDNRRPVDYAARAASLGQGSYADLLPHWRDGRIKQHVVHTLLALRARLPVLFARGGYRALAVTGPAAAHVVAFERHDARRAVIVVVARHVAHRLEEADAPRLEPVHWSGTSLAWPMGQWKEAFSGRSVHGEGAKAVGELLGDGVVAVFERRAKGGTRVGRTARAATGRPVA
ncbi:malto-oligosyltrehalose synthase [Pinirhizobacter soli]|uniref:malto-oligosyltrehalose synthase n=1 Tax=Pinirhizobacter soli TaxID=2786953 RepID=UPI00202AB9FD|nr:malto-oligosyltrehalose synthase [Pinirhizobacter soli]